VHFWVGSFCYALDNVRRTAFPRGVIAISDIITLVEDAGNQIPDKSWMLYLLELFNVQDVAVELNLICQFDDQDYFEAIFRGVNQYRFRKVLPIVGHSYLRQITMNHQSRSISYLLNDSNSGLKERFDLPIDKRFKFEGINHFTGIEWWNKIGNFPYPIRYHVEISQLLYGLAIDTRDLESIIYAPYEALVPTNEGTTDRYPISFYDARIEADGYLHFKIGSGICSTGMRFNY
jgi:hypothetical protein